MKKILIFVVLAIALVINPVHAAGQSQETTPTPPPTPLIVGIGQSNMAGGLPITSTTSIQTLTNVKMMKINPATTISDPSWYWVNMHEPSSVWGQEYNPNYINTTPEKFKKYGPATEMMRKLMILTSGQKAGFLNCGVGGSAITTWLPGPGDTNFNRCWARIATARLANYIVVGLVFINGESDTNKEVCDSSTKSNLTYTKNFNKLYDTLVDIHHLNNRDLPLVFVRLGEASEDAPDFSAKHPCWEDIRNQQTLLYQQSTNPYWRMVSATGLDRETKDGLHYIDQATYNLLGQKLANQLFSALPTPSPLP